MELLTAAKLRRNTAMPDNTDNKKPGKQKDRDVILLQDLQPKHDVIGGSKKRLFGESVEQAKDREKKTPE
ncbi:MAG: hypothetical protein D6719_12175 [Candidatus Dadabacteria bacterium]|nr:MAG: hypothetical protein D6719_12175 [Candidatus Dadabacteria bacterium]